MDFLIFDTETNGLPIYRDENGTVAADDPRQPRLAAIAMIQASITEAGEIAGGTVEELLFVWPEGWAMTPEAHAVNGLTDEMLKEHGVPVADALDRYEALVRSGLVVAAYNAQHDCKIMRGEFRRAGRDDLFKITTNTCCMRGAQKVVRIPGKRGWPKLTDAYAHLTGAPFPGEAHKPMNDARAALRVLAELIKRGAMIPPAVHYAKDGPGNATGPGF